MFFEIYLKDKLGLILLPATPKILLVAYDKRQIKITLANLDNQDVKNLNAIQILVSNRAIYSNIILKSKKRKIIQKLMKSRRINTGTFENDFLQVPYLVYPGTKKFSFIQKN